MNFGINKIKYDEKNTDHVLNIPTGLWNALWQKVMQQHPIFIYHKIIATYYTDKKWRSVDKIFRHCFGPAQTTKLYTLRNYIWVFSNQNATLYCLISSTGVSFEYNKKTSDQKEVLKLLSDVIKTIEAKAPRKGEAK